MENVFIEIMGVRVEEPATVLTNFLVSVVGIYAFIKLVPPPKRQPAFIYFRYYFLFIALGTAFGATAGHGFQYYLNEFWKLPGWFFGAIAVTLIEMASIEMTTEILHHPITVLLRILAILKIGVLATITVNTLSFTYVVIHSAIGFLFVILPLHIFSYKLTNSKSSMLMIKAVGVAVMSAIVFVFKLGINEWFNHKDVGHLFLALLVYLFYKAASSRQFSV